MRITTRIVIFITGNKICEQLDFWDLLHCITITKMKMN